MMPATMSMDPEMNIIYTEDAQNKSAVSTTAVAPAAPQPTVKLLSYDGEVFDVDYAAAVQSDTVKMLLEASPLFDEHHTKTLKFPSIE